MSVMTAISGLLVYNNSIDVISNNIANASTIGYKSSKPVFFDMLSNSFYSNTVKGFGVGISNIVQDFNNGMLIETGKDLDLGIEKEGFFRILDSHGHIHYTRNGQFLIDKNKNIINMQGMYLTGLNNSSIQNNCNNTYNLEPINLKNATILKAKPTSEIQLNICLNSKVNPISNINDTNNNIPQITHYKTNITIYDKNEQENKIDISFNKVDKNTWKVNLISNDSDNSSNKKSINSSFTLKFNTDGELISEKIFNIQSKDSKYENITLDLNGTTEQADADNSCKQFSQNGHSRGFLKTFNIESNGEIIGVYSNQNTQIIGKILLSKFINPEKLKPESGNIWSATEESGIENTGSAGDSGFGFLTVQSLEASNVDLNKELINMIVAQRNYQSNAQSFKTEDKIINTLINLR